MPLPHPDDIAEKFVALLPSPLTPTTLEEYGVTSLSAHTETLSTVVLSLSLFWVDCALRVALPVELQAECRQAIRQRVEGLWAPIFTRAGSSCERFWAELPARHNLYESIMRQGGEPAAVLSIAAQECSGDQGLIGSQGSSLLLGLFLDLVPIQEIGDLAMQLESEWR